MEVLGGASVRVEPSDWSKLKRQEEARLWGGNPCVALSCQQALASMGLTSALAGITSGPW